jgi:Zn-finger protein
VSYKAWLENHSQKHQKIMEKLTGLTNVQIIEYFRFENMVKNEIDFCPLYKDNIKCHDVENLNCYLCACPNFRVSSMKSYCSINSPDGGEVISQDGYIHQDCSKCIIPHKELYIKENFDRNYIKYIQCYPPPSNSTIRKKLSKCIKTIQK